MNKFIGIGNLGYDPDNIGNGCKLTVAIQDNYNKDKVPLWVDVLVFSKQSENCLQYLKKGRRVLVEGKLEMSKKGAIIIIASDVKFL